MWNEALCGALHQSRETKVLVVKYILPVIASVILVLVFVIVWTRCRKKETKIPSQDNIFDVATQKRVSYLELLRATNGFSESNLIGTGSYGSVYQGTLSDGMMVAIKVFNLQLEGSFRSFDVECEVMRNILSSCSNLDFKALLLDYMPNGSLEKWLYSHNYCLDILQRLNIMIDVASALEYLHHGYSSPVVHCDIKPSNVLLDDDMIAHLGDFGIAKLLGRQESMAQTKTLATIGYIAPEYGSQGIVSTKGDVYSYGIMLLETFTRKKPTDEMLTGEMSLKSWVKESLPSAVIEVLDPNILSREDEHFNVKEHCVESIMELAMSCCAELPEEGMNMNDALATLKKIKIAFLVHINV